jgi:hypothetical protein
MNRILKSVVAVAFSCLLILTSCDKEQVGSGTVGSGAVASVTVPFTLDHNRMLVEAEVQRQDGTWRTARLWVDSGNPDFFMSEELASDLGIDLPAGESHDQGRIEVQPPAGVRIGAMPLSFEGVSSQVIFQPEWLFSTMHNDANLPATVLKQYQVVFDYPAMELTIAEPGRLQPRGEAVPAGIHPTTGIVQIDAVIDGESLSFALDNGASYSFASDELLDRISGRHPDWPQVKGAAGCANIWGWWPGEEAWPLMRLPVIEWGPVQLADTGLVGLPRFFPDGAGLGEWYSHKTARPVEGVLGPNAYKAYRIEIDYVGSTVYFEAGAAPDAHDLDIVGLTLRPAADGSYQVIGIVEKDGAPVVEGVVAGDRLLEVGGIEATGATMGTVVDALRGEPGETRSLLLDRDGEQITIDVTVERLL